MRRGLWLAFLVAGAGCTPIPVPPSKRCARATCCSSRRTTAGRSVLRPGAGKRSLPRGDLSYRGVAYRNQGNYDQALLDIDRAMELGMSGRGFWPSGRRRS